MVPCFPLPRFPLPRIQRPQIYIREYISDIRTSLLLTLTDTGCLCSVRPVFYILTLFCYARGSVHDEKYENKHSTGMRVLAIMQFMGLNY